MPSQHQKAAQFRALHEMPGAFVLPNVWDGGSASLMAGLGFAAVATSSSAAAATLGKLDGALTREEALAHARLVAQVSPLPVAADLENGFGHSPEAVAETIRLAIQAGLVGASIEDASGDPAAPIYDFDHALARVAAAVRAAREAPFPFTLTARAENFLHGTRGSARHAAPPAGVRAGRSRRALRPGPAGPGGRAQRLRCAASARSISWWACAAARSRSRSSRPPASSASACRRRYTAPP